MWALDQQPLVLDPVTEAFEAAHLPIASLEQPTEPEDSASDSNAFAAGSSPPSSQSCPIKQGTICCACLPTPSLMLGTSFGRMQHSLMSS